MTFPPARRLSPRMMPNEEAGPAATEASTVTVGSSSGAPSSPLGTASIVLILSGPIAPPAIPAFCGRAGEAIRLADGEQVVCDVAALVDPDAATVDALARLQLTARRLGRRLQLRWACQDLQALLAMMGLSEVLPCGDVSDLEPGRQAEQREQARGVQEEADPRDPPL